MISNRVYVYNEMGAPKPEPEKALAPHFPDIYNVEFLEDTYKLPQFAIPERWGCIKYLDNGQEDCPDSLCGSLRRQHELGLLQSDWFGCPHSVYRCL